MKFIPGQIVKHKLNNIRLVLVKVFEKGIFRRNTVYYCSYGEEARIVKETIYNDYLSFYEEELEECKNDANLGAEE